MKAAGAIPSANTGRPGPGGAGLIPEAAVKSAPRGDPGLIPLPPASLPTPLRRRAGTGEGAGTQGPPSAGPWARTPVFLQAPQGQITCPKSRVAAATWQRRHLSPGLNLTSFIHGNEVWLYKHLLGTATLGHMGKLRPRGRR